jgi:hypothetical protein
MTSLIQGTILIIMLYNEMVSKKLIHVLKVQTRKGGMGYSKYKT